MCDFSGRLVAWMDGELPENDTAVVERHVQGCAECSARVAAYEEASRGFAVHYEAVTQAAMAAKPGRKLPRWVPVLAAAGLAAMLLLALLPRSAKPAAPTTPQIAVAAPGVAAEPITTVKAVEPVKAVQRRRVVARKKAQPAEWAAGGPAIQIAIPAGEMFPPGAVPEGVTYIANMNLSADGSVQGVRLQQ